MKRFLVLVMSAGLLILSLANASLVSAANYGDCSTKGNWLAGEQVNPTVRGIKVTLDPAQVHICSNPGTLDNGALQGVFISAETGGGEAGFGYAVCDFNAPFCDATETNRTAKRVFLSIAECQWPFFDDNFDIGPVDYGAHTYTMLHYSSDNSWHIYVDGVIQSTHIYDSMFPCLDPDVANVYGFYQTERFDAGDGSDVDYTGMKYIPTGSGSWVTMDAGSSCDFNNRTVHPGAQTCLIVGGATDEMTIWTTY